MTATLLSLCSSCQIELARFNKTVYNYKAEKTRHLKSEPQLCSSKQLAVETTNNSRNIKFLNEFEA